MKEIPILKTGRYKDANGHTYDITPAMLEDMAKHTSQNSAPLVKGHPKNEAPAMGWVDSLRVVGDKLLARFNKVAPEFADEIQAENFKNVSASFFAPYAPSNPQQGHYVLRHVGALGAARPAIPGLGTLQEALSFCEDEDGIIALSENALEEPKNSIYQAIKSFFGGVDVEALKAKIRSELMAEFSEKINQEKHRGGDGGDTLTDREKELQAQLEASEAALAKEKAERERLTKEAETAQHRIAVSAEVEKVAETKEVSAEQKTGLIDKALALVGAGKKPDEAVAAFAEYLPDRVQRTGKNWGNHGAGRGTADFSDENRAENTKEFAIKKSEFEKAGHSPEQAYDMALTAMGGK